MEKLFELSFTVMLQERFSNSWVAADDGALTLAGVDIRGAALFLETRYLKV